MSRISERPISEVREINAALMRLAWVTRDTGIDEMVAATYISNLDDYDASVIVAACRHLESTAMWFPKCAELITAIRKERHRLRMEENDRLLRENPGTPIGVPDKERHQALMARIRETVYGKRIHGA